MSANARKMCREEAAAFVATIPGIHWKERRNSAGSYPRGAWKVVDRAKTALLEAGQARSMRAQIVLEVVVRDKETDIDDQIDEVLYQIEEASARYVCSKTFAGTEPRPYKGQTRSIAWDSDHPRVLTTEEGIIEGTVYVLLTLEYIAGR